jgi:hypothetical protein
MDLARNVLGPFLDRIQAVVTIEDVAKDPSTSRANDVFQGSRQVPVEEYVIFTAGPAKALCGDQPDVHVPLYTESLDLLRDGVKEPYEPTRNPLRSYA